MPIKEAAKKALRQSIKRRVQNIERKDKIKLAAKQLKSLTQSGKKEEAKQALSLAYKAIDKALKKKVLKPNTAARKKSKLARLINSTK